MADKKIAFDLRITGETSFDDDESSLESVIFCMEEDLRDAGWNVVISPIESADKPIITNADRIRSMTDEQLANLLSSAWNKTDYEDDDYDPAWLKWLRQPVDIDTLGDSP